MIALQPPEFPCRITFSRDEFSPNYCSSSATFVKVLASSCNYRDSLPLKEERTHKRDIQGEEKPLTRYRSKFSFLFLHSKPCRVGIIAATNRIEDIDEAVVRRFECKIYVGVPRKDDRKQLIVKYLTGCDFTLSDKELEHITTETYGWSGSDIEVSAFYTKLWRLIKQ